MYNALLQVFNLFIHALLSPTFSVETSGEVFSYKWILSISIILYNKKSCDAVILLHSQKLLLQFNILLTNIMTMYMKKYLYLIVSIVI